MANDKWLAFQVQGFPRAIGAAGSCIRGFRRATWFERWSREAKKRADIRGEFWCGLQATLIWKQEPGASLELRLVSALRCIGSMAMPIDLGELMPSLPPHPPNKEGPGCPRTSVGGILALF